MTTVQYHVEDGVGRPAIRVRDWHAGMDYRTGIAGTIVAAMPDDGKRWTDGETILACAYERVRSDFWQNAEEIATQRGLGEIAQEGRSGGWLVFTDGRDPQDPESFCADTEEDGGAHAEGAVREWLADYRAMVEWADAWIADAPRKVAALAQQYAMDEAGEAAAFRFFACDPGFPHRYKASVARGNAIMAGYEEGATA